MESRKKTIRHNMIFKKYRCSPTGEPINMLAFGNNYRAITSDIVEPVIKREMELTRAKFCAMEEIFVDDNITENPIKWIQESSSPFAMNCICMKKQQMANLINEAELKLRHQFQSKALLGNIYKLEGLRFFIAGIEGMLKRKGVPENDLRRVRSAMGIDNVRVVNLEEIKRSVLRDQ